LKCKELKSSIYPPPPTKLVRCWVVALFLLMGSLSSGLAQVGSVTINGNQNVTGGSTWTYSIIGTSCSSANWIVNGGTITSQNNISVTVQWNNTNGNGTVQVSSYGCSPTPENRAGFLSITLTSSLTPYFCNNSPIGNGRVEGCDALLIYTVCNMPSNCGYIWTYKRRGQAPATTYTATNVWGEFSGCTGGSAFEYVCVRPACTSSPSLCANY
jgi:hypothetical protein